MTRPNLPEWFCLQEGQRNFGINPERDRGFMFGIPDWEKNIENRLKHHQLLASPLRVLYWGQYGIGKTHRLRHMEFLIQNRGYEYYPCYVVASDIQDKTGFESLHYDLVTRLGREKVHEYFRSYQRKAEDPGSRLRSIDELCAGNADVLEAFRIFGNAAERSMRHAWQFLSGRKIGKTEMEVVGVSRDRLSRATDYSAVIGVLATVIQEETGRQLMYLIDECENMLRVTQKTAEAQWNEALRALLDLDNLSFVVTVGAEKSDNIPVLWLKPDIVRRIQKDNYVEMAAFKVDETESFVKGLLSRWIDREKLDALVTAEGLDNTAPDFDRDCYPFTRGGLELFCENIAADPRSARPSVILDRLNKVAAEAFIRGRRLINKDHLAEMGMA